MLLLTLALRELLAVASVRGLPYEPPSTEGLHFAETFDGEVFSRWHHSRSERYGNVLQHRKREPHALVGDLAFFVPEGSQNYASFATFKPIISKKGVPFVLQYEVRFGEALVCGGAYIKLFNSEQLGNEKGFHEKTPYVIMFGPDMCGLALTDKVHFILQHKNRKTGKWEEKHFRKPPYVPRDRRSHLYTLIIKPDNSFQILVDGVVKAKGNLLRNDMSPAVNPKEYFEDSNDRQPSDWTNEKEIPDPNATKPVDWDEKYVHAFSYDLNAKMPDGWKEDAPWRIPDPFATQPAIWITEEDGEWGPPLIDNPSCTVGCGRWRPPFIRNNDFKGSWKPPMIPNPAFKGVWMPRQIPNPEYFFDPEPYLFPKINAVGIDIWTMQAQLYFDNIIITTDPQKAEDFANRTWRIRHEIELKQLPPEKDAEDWKEPGPSGPVSQFVTDVMKRFDDLMAHQFRKHTYVVMVIVVSISIFMLFVCCCVCDPDTVVYTVSDSEDE